MERRELLRHTAALRRQHLAHAVSRSLPAEVQAAGRGGLPPWGHQLDHAGSAWQGELRPCGCDRELALARQCMQVRTAGQEKGSEGMGAAVVQQ